MLSLPLLPTVAAVIAIVALRYLAVSGGFAWLTGRLRPGLYAGERMRRQMRTEIRWSLIAAVIYAIPAALALYAWQAHGLTRIYTSVSAIDWLWMPASLALYLVLHDTWFYWTHRFMHTPWGFRVMHKVHHDSRPPTAWAAMAFHPWEALTGAFLIPALTFFIPIHVAVLGLVMAVMSLFGVTNHMGWELFPRPLINGPFGKLVITASHHQRHHRDYLCNFGLYFRVWDQLCGTDRGLGEFDANVAPAAAAGSVSRRGITATAGSGFAAPDA
jgi:sterol desaturase/sphingolipid hydroxylase (fatty acid hydroxylase superfamily)